MTGSKPISTSRLARGSKLGAVVAVQAVRKRRTKLSMIGRSAEVRAAMADASVLRLAEQLVLVLGEMKGLAMKLGQLLSLLDLELVPPRYRETFQRRLAVLFDHAPTVEFAAMRGVIEEDFGKPLRELFAEFEPEPIAAASIGQVYRARLFDGTEVAVKVQYPGIDLAVRADLRNLGMLRIMMQQVALPGFTVGVLDELRANFEKELDYDVEARTQRHVANMYADHPFITVPQAFPEHSSRRVLVTEYSPGIDFEAMRALPEAERDRIGEIVYRFYVGSLFELAEFCGDPHPGNLLLRPDGRVVFLDFGLYKRMQHEQIAFEAVCLRATAEDRDDELYRLMVERGVIDEHSSVTPQECYNYVLSAAEWSLVDEELPLTPELASAAFLHAVDPRIAEFDGMRRQNLPPEHLFSRRVDFWTCATLGHLRATANWHRIAREWLYDEEPTTDLGRLHQDWRRRHGLDNAARKVQSSCDDDHSVNNAGVVEDFTANHSPGVPGVAH
ncbi:AarF/ABC1/UbiB kinase family protein [Nocardia sp. SYP-A9097]|uniref:ABC1 kinase family protein n=1 Tax=Nocardia sp. SYP-A9097 TaxID=2663237 RepID=UPI00129BBDFF|nr:AarF/ABC1/UbiB kinase family protein [Nocardia sp. SYP-A9097]MRH88182.1 AarF/ABC1/UbiB kinase family protein [Nocardia sp. SYP-A9097]